MNKMTIPTHNKPVEGLTNSIRGINFIRYQPPHILNHGAQASYAPLPTRIPQDEILGAVQINSMKVQLLYRELGI